MGKVVLNLSAGYLPSRTSKLTEAGKSSKSVWQPRPIVFQTAWSTATTLSSPNQRFRTRGTHRKLTRARDTRGRGGDGATAFFGCGTVVYATIETWSPASTRSQFSTSFPTTSGHMGTLSRPYLVSPERMASICTFTIHFPASSIPELDARGSERVHELDNILNLRRVSSQHQFGLGMMRFVYNGQVCATVDAPLEKKCVLLDASQENGARPWRRRR
uniref:HNH nuclease domain-containing protein n=1 Tax=Mycena chlorophos TaxID=658473 RepID=A0ABQ0LKR0_MYCCL|nr:predicted protein [Mycena chlorophos]